ncbi:MAG: hypothetical protein P1V18_01225 [Candidatus Gracilibacteria bacterium]|nr:hypothetical protein [Candidatus Gracilibacteria bacterium]
MKKTFQLCWDDQKRLLKEACETLDSESLFKLIEQVKCILVSAAPADCVGITLRKTYGSNNG